MHAWNIIFERRINTNSFLKNIQIPALNGSGLEIEKKEKSSCA